MTRYLQYRHVVDMVHAEGIGPVRDPGLLKSAVERPQTTLMGVDAYPSLHLKAAALMHSLCLNHALVDGNKRIAAIAMSVFLDINGEGLSLTNDELFDLVMAVASGELRDVPEIAARLRTEAR
ncbi:type II toxin-antitoxin system death-on-curing family toxin [Demequina sp.]|uniref:type II toxin-antitoxin system death-on-curing family toxin n=1 Tax=Demequina sp. TaxID=2050685 RepID=UPI003D0ADDE1